MPTPVPKEHEIERKWFLVDADGQVLGRLATRVASILRGKHKSTFTPHLDVGDHVVVVNAEKIHVTGRKRTDKMYRWHSGYIGGLREVPFEKMVKSHPEKKLKVYRGAGHPHEAQQPQALPATPRGGEGR
jgi:large subunit ribosomal protein L13